MRHTIHIMLGSDAGQILKDIKEYVIKYGDDQTNDFFNAVLYSHNFETGDAEFSTAVQVGQNPEEFVPGIDEMYEAQFSDLYLIPADARAEYLQGFFTDMYNRSITINHPGDSSSLNLCIHVPLYKEYYWKLVREFLDAIETIPQSFNVDLFLLPYDLAFLFEKDVNNLPKRLKDYSTCTKSVLNDILGARGRYESLGKLVLVQNCNAEGLSLDLNADSFVRIVGEYALLSVSNYPEMFPVSAQDSNRPLHALGLSVLSFDKYYFVQYLLHKAYTYILDRENVSQTEVEVNKVSQIVQSLLSKNVGFFSKFYDKEVETRLNKKVKQTDIISQVSPLLNNEIERLTNEFQSYISDSELSLPEKKATLAQLLGEDDDLLTGYMFNKKQLIIDDCSREVLDLFVEANNKLCNVDAGDASDDNNESARSIKDYAVLSKEGEPVELASRLLDKLKETKVTMRQSTNYIRQKTQELDGLNVQKKDYEESGKRLTDKGFVFEGRTYKLLGNVAETELDDEYQPVENLAASIDLRANFTSVKDQGQMGACTAFATVSIFESILKKNDKKDSDLSEQFVYYNARKSESSTSIDGGCSLFSAVKTMAMEGVCSEELFPYNPDCYTAKPPLEAYSDAENRKVVKAKSVKRNLNDLKSAVFEGYPVAISLKIFDSFNPNRGFIPMPSDEEIASGESGYHAMVICGYNDEAKFFVVRNSWGVQFGDKGYCYIPYAYVSNTDLLNGACIITEISDTKFKVEGADLKAVVSFDMTDSNIKSEILKNLIQEEKVVLGRLRYLLEEQSRNFNLLFQFLGNNANRDSICEGTHKRIDYEVRQLDIRKQQMQDQRVADLNNFDSSTKKCHIIFGVYLALYIIAMTIACVAEKSYYPLINVYAYISYGVVALSCVLYVFFARYRKRQRKELDMEYREDLQNIACDISKREREKEIIHLKTHIAGMIIDSFYKLNINLHTKYYGMKSYVGNLKTWREQEVVSLNMSPLVREPFLTLISNDTLEKFFESQKDNITRGVDLSKMFRDKYTVQESEIVKFKNELKSTLVKMLFDSIKDFSIYNYLINKQQYQYVNRDYTDIDSLLQQMDLKSSPFVRMNPTIVATDVINTYCKMMFIHAEDNDCRQQWESACGRNFSDRPTLHPSTSHFKLTLLQLRGVSEKDISILC